MAVYSVDKLMRETRRLAAEYHEATGQALPITQELARYDVKRLLGLQDPDHLQAAVDAIADWPYGARVQIKGRVIFNDEKGRHRLGQLNADGLWDCVVLIIYNAQYEADEIYVLPREVLEEQSYLQSNSKKRGILSVAKFKNIGFLLWNAAHGRQSADLWENHS